RARGCAVGVEGDGRARRPEPGQHALENVLAADADARLVAAAHAPRQPAGEHETEWRRRSTHSTRPANVIHSWPTGAIVRPPEHSLWQKNRRAGPENHRLTV